MFYEVTKYVCLVFEEKESALKLGPFGRFFLTSVLTGGRYERVYISSANHALMNDKNITLLTRLRVHFTIDFAKQAAEDLFIKDGSLLRNHRQTASPAQLCARRLLHVPMISFRKKFHWFTHQKNITQFRDSYSKMCNITYNKPILAPRSLSLVRIASVSYTLLPNQLSYSGLFSQARLDDEYSIVREHGGLRGDKSQYNVFRKTNESEVLRVVITNTESNVQNVLIYQVI
jgi:hypothetical protein